jgi:hypothetical protein
MDNALTEAGWDRADVLQERWLRIALMHVSYLYERGGEVLANARQLQMFGALGSRRCRFFVLEEFLARDPLASGSEQSRSGAEPVLTPVEPFAVLWRQRDAGSQ